MVLLFKRSLICFIVFFLIGCGSGKSTIDKNIVIWHYSNDRQEALNQLAQKYKEQTGINVEFKLFSPPDLYTQKVIAAARAGNLPDIFSMVGEKKTFASFVKVGYILDLTPYMQEESNAWQKSFYNRTLDVDSFKEDNPYGVKPGIYGVPIDTCLVQIVYNKKLFKDAGLDPNNPATNIDDFIKQAQTIKDKLKVSGFVSGWSEGWLLNCIATSWAMNIMGEEKFLKTLKGEVPYTDKQWIDLFNIFVKLRDSGILNPNITTMINKESEEIFSKDKAAFSLNGSWGINIYKQLNPDLDYGYIRIPRVANLYPLKTWGGAGMSFMVNAKSQNKEEAVKLLRWLTSKDQQVFLVKNTNNLPAIKGCKENLPKALQGFIKDFKNFTHPDVWPYMEDSEVIEVRDRGLQRIVMGIMTPEEVAKEMQEVKERLKRR